MVVVIIGILMALAIPNYQRTIDRNYRRKAQDVLLTIYHGERAYFLKNGGYRSLSATDAMDAWREINMDNPNDPPGTNPTVLFSVPSATPPADPPPPSPLFTATAVRKGGSCNDRQLEIHETRSPITGNWLTC